MLLLKRNDKTIIRVSVFWDSKRRIMITYIRKHDKTLFSSLWLSGELNAYIANIDRQADEMFSQLVRDIAKNENVTERLKATDQMEWVRRMNNIRHRA